MLMPFVPPLLRAALVRTARASQRISRTAPTLLAEIGLAGSCSEQVRVWTRGELSEADAALELRLLAVNAEQALREHVVSTAGCGHASGALGRPDRGPRTGR